MNRQCNTDLQGAPMGYFDWIWRWSHQKVYECLLVFFDR
jgi:heme/copper-type cytochrome/quinol oxidase subunit 1